MRILYLSLSYVPSRRASSVQVMKMCAALAGRGHDVTLVVKGCRAREESGVDDVHGFYGVEPSFAIERLPRPAFRGGGLVYLAGLWRLLRRRRAGVDLVYCRELWGAWMAARQRLPVVFEAHAPPAGALARRAFARLVRQPPFRRLVTISEALRRTLEGDGSLPRGVSVVVAHDAADPLPPSPDGRPGAAADAGPRAGYVGSLYRGRGLGLLLELARRRPEWSFHLVGGSPPDLDYWRSRQPPPNCHFHGFRPPGELAAWYEGFDALLMPYRASVRGASGNQDYGAWMSPLKLFEYLAAGKAIVASDLPILREVLEDGRNAVLVEADDVEAWSRALARLAADEALRRRLGAAARDDHVRRHTWDRRAGAVLAGL